MLRIKSDFTKNVLKLFSGTTLANGLTILILPILTRLYDKADFGNFQLLVSTIMIFSVVSSLKYEMAIVLPSDENEADHMVVLSLIVLVITTLFFAALFFLGGDIFLNLLNARNLKPYVFLISIGIFFSGLWQSVQYILIRKKEFGILSRNKVYQSSVTQGGAVALGVFSPSFLGLYISQMAGYLVAAILILKRKRIVWKEIRYENLKKFAVKHKKFPLINTFMVFLNTLSLQLPVFMFSRYFNAEVVGLYMIANRVVNAPVSLLGKSVSQVYFQAASEACNLGGNKLLKIYKKTVKQLAGIGIIPVIVILFGAPVLVRLFLGEEWEEAGTYMQIIIIWVYFQFINMPISSTYSVMNRQEVGFYLILISLVVRFLAMFLFNSNPIEMLLAVSISAAAFYATYNLSIYYFIKRLKL
ncbi:MAG: oligosaccharide flippase family protein [Calditrichia bacterium]